MKKAVLIKGIRLFHFLLRQNCHKHWGNDSELCLVGVDRNTANTWRYLSFPSGFLLKSVSPTPFTSTIKVLNQNMSKQIKELALAVYNLCLILYWLQLPGMGLQSNFLLWHQASSCDVSQVQYCLSPTFLDISDQIFFPSLPPFFPSLLLHPFLPFVLSFLTCETPFIIFKATWFILGKVIFHSCLQLPYNLQKRSRYE